MYEESSINSNKNTTKPFEGLLVVAIEQAVAAPLCSAKLVEAGARVIKVERHSGDFARNYDNAIKGESAYFVWANHGKESLVLDIKNTNDAETLESVLEKADVFIQNLAPGAACRAGFGSDELRQRYPRLITCDISGYGEEGDYAKMKAYDFLVQCESGMVSISGAPEAYGRIGVSLCDIGAGMNALIGIQQALSLRQITGRGTGVKVSLFDTAADWMTVPLMHHDYTGKAPQRVGMHHPSIAPYGGYKTLDDEILVISIQNEREWSQFCTKVLNAPELIADKRFCNVNMRVANREALDQEVNAIFSQLKRAQMEKILRLAGIAYGAVNSVESLSSHPQLRRRAVTLSDGEKAQLISPAVRFTHETGDEEYLKIPKLGEHTENIIKEFCKQN
jgi:crotonobetainyl-CoA:carnitine CoA-transferase CaiB-like acyl-CoA transferase